MEFLRKDPWNLIRIIPAKENDLPSRRQMTQQSSPSFSPFESKPASGRADFLLA
jgi:hypothetical protein